MDVSHTQLPRKVRAFTSILSICMYTFIDNDFQMFNSIPRKASKHNHIHGNSGMIHSIPTVFMSLHSSEWITPVLPRIALGNERNLDWATENCSGYGMDHAWAIEDCSGYGMDHAWATDDCSGYGMDHAWATDDCSGYGMYPAWATEDCSGYRMDHAWATEDCMAWKCHYHRSTHGIVKKRNTNI